MVPSAPSDGNKNSLPGETKTNLNFDESKALDYNEAEWSSTITNYQEDETFKMEKTYFKVNRLESYLCYVVGDLFLLILCLVVWQSIALVVS